MASLLTGNQNVSPSETTESLQWNSPLSNAKLIKYHNVSQLARWKGFYGNVLEEFQFIVSVPDNPTTTCLIRNILAPSHGFKVHIL